MRSIEAREEEIQVGDNFVTVYSHQSALNPEIHIVTVLVGGTEMTYHAPTRGEGLVDLADFLKDLSYALRKMAFEQEGAIRLPETKLRP